MGRVHSAKLAILMVILFGSLGPRVWNVLGDRWERLSSLDLGERWATAREDRGIRVRRTLGNWDALHQALLEHVPRDAIIVIRIPEKYESAKGIQRINTEARLLFPRAVVGYRAYVGYYQGERDSMNTSLFLVNVKGGWGFLGQELFEEIVQGDRFSLWRYRGAS